MNKNIALWILALIIVALAAFNIGRRSVHCKPATGAETAAACGTPASAFPTNLPPPPPPSESNSSH
ncbi:hypothetical protein B9G69_016460 [Bdellovibrio sp. SKB1291214]|uniref:hypothetical protein n=1 Tax=Bdellovibrio sp. SKB1291214 TaxID=1732569 RepID=UPI000B51A8D4|nr:hypothetical protein [Bdellovibrio sp. SKB1291214]UYL08637.1 hypothetical protein B9G69_016460 [Bdellovibrio sp. SKB1291214]